MQPAEIVMRIYESIPMPLIPQLREWLRQAEWDEINGDDAAFDQTEWPLLMVVSGRRRDNGEIIFAVYLHRGPNAWTWGASQYWFGRSQDGSFRSGVSPREAAVAANRYYPMLLDGEEHFLKMRRPRP